jgi:hypothetical protein
VIFWSGNVEHWSASSIDHGQSWALWKWVAASFKDMPIKAPQINTRRTG